MLKIGSFSCDKADFLKIGCAAVVVCGAVVYVSEQRKKIETWRKSACIQMHHYVPIQQKLQQLDKEDDPKERTKVLKMSAKVLIQSIQDGKISPRKAVRFYIYQACLVNSDLNCVAQLVDDAEEVALELNTSFGRNKKLFGLPVSLKENFETKGLDCTTGLLQCVDDPALADAVLVQVLKHCGAVPFVKTNLSQATSSFESSNPLYGATVHPLNKHFTPGGSSSGEGSLIASGGSVLGFGTDSGGSIRCPSHFCGIAGFKPTTNRISSKGIKDVGGQVGPMSKEVDNLVMAINALLCPLMFRLDPNVPPIPFNKEVFYSKAPLRIGYYHDDGYLKPVPAIVRSVEIVKRALSNMGHTLLPFNVPHIEHALNIFTEKGIGVVAHDYLNCLENEYIDPVLNVLLQKLWMSSFMRWIRSWWLSKRSKRMAKDLRLHKKITSISHLLSVDKAINKYKEEFHEYWINGEYDVIICPPFPVTACKLGSLNDPSGLTSYAYLYNLLGYPAGVVPVTKVNESDIKALQQYKGHYGDDWDKHIKQISQDSLGMPVGVQCVALPYNDEVCLRLMKEIEGVVDYASA